ncbi:cyclodeaminase/cyclohydrolase family protein [Arhodomonas sp. SL1]|uniref:cyclodeaminase/cyclohydrolase family protein n=1 Tax=Arhodomonas sp. SL1 TaxID=3425691 RepID=UPI003F88259F
MAARADEMTATAAGGISEFLEALAARRSAPSGGAGAGLTVATAAALVAMSARFAERRRADAAEIAAEADALRDRALALMEADAAAFAPVLRASRWGDAGALEDALEGACEVPMELLEMAVRLAELADELVRTGNPRLAGDARAALALATGGGRAAAALIDENLDGDHDEGLAAQAAELADRLP